MNIFAYQNVFIQKINKKTKESKMIQASNSITYQLLINLISGLQSGTMSPINYFALGEGTRTPALSDTQLQSQIGDRILIEKRSSSRQFDTDMYVLTLKTSVEGSNHESSSISEAGLFFDANTSSCSARVIFEPFELAMNEVLDISWEIIIGPGTQ